MLKTIGDHVRKHRLDLDIEQKEAARKIGISLASVVNWENDHTQPRVSHMPGVIRFLGYSPLPECDNLAQQLVQHRKQIGLSQERFARLLGVDPTTLARWECGKRKPVGVHLGIIKKIIGFVE